MPTHTAPSIQSNERLLRSWMGRTAGAICLALTSAVGSAASLTLPQAPAAPTSMSECDRLSTEWSSISRDLSQRHTVCIASSACKNSQRGYSGLCQCHACHDLHVLMSRMTDRDVVSHRNQQIQNCRQQVSAREEGRRRWEREQRAMEERNQQQAREQQAMRERWAADDRRERERQRTTVTPLPQSTSAQRQFSTPIPQRSNTQQSPANAIQALQAFQQMWQERREERDRTERGAFESSVNQVHERGSEALDQYQDARQRALQHHPNRNLQRENRVVSAIQDGALADTRYQHIQVARQWDQAISSLDQLEGRSAASGTQFNMRGSPDPALRNSTPVSNLDVLEARQTHSAATSTASLQEGSPSTEASSVPSYRATSNRESPDAFNKRPCRSLVPGGPERPHGDRTWEDDRMVECKNGTWVAP